MSTFEKFDEVKFYFGRFIGPVVSILFGIFLFSKTATVTMVEQFDPNSDEPVMHELVQNDQFRLASLFLVLVGIIWLLYVLNVLRSYIGLAVTLVSLGIVAFLLSKDYLIVKEDVDFANRKEMIYKEIKGRINDIKIAQNEYKNEYGYYTNNFDSLIDYVKNGKTIKFVRKGVLPARKLTREEADFIYGRKANKALDNDITDIEAKALLNMPTPPADLNGIVRDTTYEPVIETAFQNNAYLEQRKKKDLIFDFHPDSLRYIPFSGNEVKMDTSSVFRGELRISTLLVQMPHSIDTAFTHAIGDTTDNSLKDNWSLR